MGLFSENLHVNWLVAVPLRGAEEPEVRDAPIVLMKLCLLLLSLTIIIIIIK